APTHDHPLSLHDALPIWATLWNLDSAGFQGWARLSTRPDDDHNETIVPFKSGERKKIENEGYTIIANVGDQQSDLDGGSAECTRSEEHTSELQSRGHLVC